MWAITSYFNPMRYRRRLENYRQFRAHLAVPLVAVELSYGPEFELGTGDADILLQRRGRDVLWQKERLLNVALAALPAGCRYVAWVDGDVRFASPDWPGRAAGLLDRVPLVQLFSRLHHVAPMMPDRRGPEGPPLFSQTSSAAAVAAGVAGPAALNWPGERGPTAYAKGVAWAARRDVIDRHGFYDARIVGGGDTALACAAYGLFDEVVRRHHMNGPQREHYLAWGVPFHAAVGGAVACLEGHLHHYWHGRMCDRGLRQRHLGLQAFDYDPFADIAIDPAGCWRWASDKPDLHAYVRQYFESRREDG